MNVSTDTTSLKLFLHQGRVWESNGPGDPLNTYMTAEQYIAEERYRVADTVRLIGCQQNAALITRLYGRARVELVSPLVCPVAADRRDPVRTLLYMKDCMRAPSQGGFHPMTPQEQLIYEMQLLPESAQCELLRLAEQHPVWPAIQFVQGLNLVQAARLLTLIVDPRWYYDSRCDRNSRMFSYFGLKPATQRSVTFAVTQAMRRQDQAASVYAAWYCVEEARRTLIVGANMTGEEWSLHEPRNFLWRMWYALLELEQGQLTSKSQLKADLRASQRLLAYIRFNWLAAIYQDSPSLPEQRTSLFNPRMFFRYSAEVDAFTHHILGR